MKVLVTDDEDHARARLSQFLTKIDGFECIGEARSGLETIEKAESLRPDVILLDIGMSGMSGLECAHHLSLLEPPPAILFCTGYDHLALDAFHVCAQDYLLKPIGCEQLQQALCRAAQPTRANLAQLRSQPQVALARQYISTHCGRGIDLIAIKDIFYFLADDKYTKIVHTAGDVLINETLKKLEQEFSGSFIRIHRNALVAKAKISGIIQSAEQKHYVRFRDIADTLEISRRLLSAVRKELL